MKRLISFFVFALCSTIMSAQVKFDVSTLNDAIAQFNKSKDSSKKKWAKNILTLNQDSPTSGIFYRFVFPISPEDTIIDMRKVQFAVSSFINRNSSGRKIAIDWNDKNQITLVTSFGQVASYIAFLGREFDKYVQAVTRFDIEVKENRIRLTISVDKYYWSNKLGGFDKNQWAYVYRVAPYVSGDEEKVYSEAYINTCSSCLNEISEFMNILSSNYNKEIVVKPDPYKDDNW